MAGAIAEAVASAAVIASIADLPVGFAWQRKSTPMMLRCATLAAPGATKDR